MLPVTLRNRHYLLLDVLLFALTPAIALGLRVEPDSFSLHTSGLAWFTVTALFVKIFVFGLFGLYSRYWRYASVNEMISLVGAVSLATVLDAGLLLAMLFAGLDPVSGFPRSVPFIDGLLTLIAAGGPRFAHRMARERPSGPRSTAPKMRALIVGAGQAGALIARELMTSARAHAQPVAFVDDDPGKQGTWILGVPVLGGLPALPEVAATCGIQEVIIAIPSAPGTVVRQIVKMCDAAGLPHKTLPGLYELLSGRVGVTRLREVNIDDLLRREPVRYDSPEADTLLRERRVLITGAGGSIGSELCRQALRYRPAHLTLLGHGENSLFNLASEIRLLDQPGVGYRPSYTVAIADIRDRERLEGIFRQERPEIVFHAAAHKHVPLMELNCDEAVSNNVMGTQNVVDLCEAHGVERFVLVSTDKAVNPLSVMGATKRVSELIVQDAARRSGRRYVVVRFGNVLGSRGSVVPLFQKQIAAGGPITITHPEVARYFMTIPEAVQLVLQAAAMRDEESLFVLDMGAPVRIVDLAHDLMEVAGLVPGRDIEIVFSGLRPGEKLAEELFRKSERPARSSHPRILVARDTAPLSSPRRGEDFRDRVRELVHISRCGDPKQIRLVLSRMVPEYQPTAEEPVAPALARSGTAGTARPENR
ncbi:MAG: polysaccharide biosynthesis protein [Acidobacteria bacterium]|nr:polysaccharide biosynthesis protein [Acidobacteriota bacterium]